MNPMSRRQLANPTAPQNMRLDQIPPHLHKKTLSLGVPYVLTHMSPMC
jgi:hypothetical protein